MNKSFAIIATLMISISLVMGGISEAQAKRFGGARSFGGKSAFSSPYRRSTSSLPARSAGQKKAYNQNQAARQNMSRRGGLMGMLGALALGGLLGSLFFGGAFENFNFMDILVFGGIAYLLYRLFAARSGQRVQTNTYGRSRYIDDSDDDQNLQPQTQYRENNSQKTGGSAAFDTDILFKKDKNPDTQRQQTFQQDADFEPTVIPDGFDEKDFLAGAEIAFRHLQEAWDNRELAEIRGLTTDKVFAEIQEQLRASNESNKTEILKLQSELLEVREVGSELQAVVLFDCIMRENTDKQTEQVIEVWHFIKPKSSIQPKWYLDGIQQLED